MVPAPAAAAPPVPPLAAVPAPVIPPVPRVAVAAVVVMSPVASLLSAMLRLFPHLLRLFPSSLRRRMGLLITRMRSRRQRWQHRAVAAARLAASCSHGRSCLCSSLPCPHRSQDGRIVQASGSCVAGPVAAGLGCRACGAAPGVLPHILLQDGAFGYRDALCCCRCTGRRSTWWHVGAGQDAALLLHLLSERQQASKR